MLSGLTFKSQHKQFGPYLCFILVFCFLFFWFLFYSGKTITEFTVCLDLYVLAVYHEKKQENIRTSSFDNKNHLYREFSLFSG